MKLLDKLQLKADLRDASSLDGSAAMSGAVEGASAGANASYSISAAIETRF